MRASIWFVVLTCILSCVPTVTLAQDCGALDWVSPTGNLPPAMSDSAMAYDSARGRIVVFGGHSSSSTFSNSTWEYDGSRWQLMSPTGSVPTVRYGHAMVYDSARHVVVLFGGQTLTTLSSGTFEYDGVSWTLRSPTGAPPARKGHVMAYDSARARVVMFGGLQSSGSLSDSTYEYDGQSWQHVSSDGPTGRQGAVMAYDSARHVTVLHGGHTITSDDDATWEWSGAAWTLATSNGMSARSAHCMAYDSARAVMVAFGGIQQNGIYLNSTWEYGPTGWQQRTPANTPSAVSNACMAFDAARSRVVMFGGSNTSGVLDETRELVLGGNAPQFSRQPSPATANLGDTVSFHAQASGVSTWQWKKDGQVLTSGGRFAGATSPDLTINGVTGVDWGAYRAEATNSCGTTPSTPALMTQASHCGSSDYNCDGDVGTDSDIESFFACLSGNCPVAPCQSNADFNCDGEVGTDSDIETFFRVLGGASC